MSTPENPNRSSAATEAADWYARLRAQDVTEIDGLRFRAWLSGSAERRREFESLERLWQRADLLEHAPAMQRTRETIMARRRQVVQQRSRRISAVAAAALLIIGTVAWLWQLPASNVYVTDIGELRTIPVSDGSVVTLNTATEVRFDYSDTERRVELVKGQASFEVAKDKSRPFVVSAGGGEVRALGTVFDVHKDADKVTVTLIEGKVVVTPSALSPSAENSPRTAGSASIQEAASLNLSPGEQLSYLPAPIAATASPIAIKVAAVDVPRVMAWRARKLAFRDTLLTEAIAEANRYSRDQIVLEAPGMEAARLSGSFEAGKNDLFAEGLRTFFDLRIERQDDHHIILTRAPE